MSDIMERVFDAIREEREYQERLWTPGERGEAADSVGEFVLYIEDYVQEIRHTLSRQPNEVAVPKALHGIRKVAAMCVRVMEEHGIERRDMGDLKKSCELHNIRCKDGEQNNV